MDMATVIGSNESIFAKVARKATVWTGSTLAFILSVAVVLVWAVTGPIFDYSNAWQLVINTGTTIVTFWMVFLIQRAQNRDSHAIHLKLDELIAAVRGASNLLINAEQLSEQDLDELQRKFDRLRQVVAEERSVRRKHSSEEIKGASADVAETANKAGGASKEAARQITV
jgi:low affinity Fe/Cu permease